MATPHRTSSRSAAAGVHRFGTAVAVFILLVASLYLYVDRRSTLAREQVKGELLTRILFNHVSRTLEATHTLITAVNQWPDADFRSSDKLQSAIEKSSFIRSLSMVSDTGQDRKSVV